MKISLDSQLMFLLGLLFAISSINCKRPGDLKDLNGEQKDNLMHLLNKKSMLSVSDQQAAVYGLINRTIGAYHDINDFVIVISDGLKSPKGYNQDNFVLDMVDNKVRITANNALAASWGFNYYLKYYCNSSITWAGKNINVPRGNLPAVLTPVQITSNDYIRFYQNVCTHSYSYVWWDWERWEYEIDWMALNGINLVYAHTAAEAIWLQVFMNLGFTREEVDNFFVGPAFLAWFRMGNLKNYGYSLPDNWHLDQIALQKQIIQRYNELGIRYVLPAFAGFVPDQITRLYPDKNFTKSSNWAGFSCNYSCILLVDPTDDLFQTIGQAYLKEMIKTFGTGHFYSADVFNEMSPKSTDLNYLAQINAAVYKSMSDVDEDAVWVMQAWLFLDSFWTLPRVEAFLSLLPTGGLVLLDLWSEAYPFYPKFNSYYGHYFIWNMLHDFGGNNPMFGYISVINAGPDNGRAFPNSTMIGIGITMEGINQNEFIYEFFLEKSWRHTLNVSEISDWANQFAIRRYTNPRSQPVEDNFRYAWTYLALSIYDIYDGTQVFISRPGFNYQPADYSNVTQFWSAWDEMVAHIDDFSSSMHFKYDLVDVTKEVLRVRFISKYLELVKVWKSQDLYRFSDLAGVMVQILKDMEQLLASESHFLLGNWIESAKAKAKTSDESDLYEWNARTQISVWGPITVESIFDYASKAWSGMIADYYLPRWQTFFLLAEQALVEGRDVDPNSLNEQLLIKAELPFISSKQVYPTTPIGDWVKIVKTIYSKYRQ